MQNGMLPIDGTVSSETTGCAGLFISAALERFNRDFASITGTSLTGAQVRFKIACKTKDPNLLTLQAREAYRLNISGTGVTIEADGETGVVRALATVRQLMSRKPRGPVLPYVRIDDLPRFAWRGLMIDTAGHFISISTLKRQIDAMELAKLNVLHLHLNDNEGFRVESRRYPRLTSLATHGQYYTQQEIRDLVRYASERAVRIVPEVDMPGHNLALLSAYPELAVAPINPHDPLILAKGVLNPASEKTYKFLDGLLTEITALFPDKYFHVGGDEVADAAWKDSAAVEEFKRAHGFSTKQQVEASFHSRVRAILAARGKSTIGWDEMADGPLPKDVVIESWRSSNPVSTATAAGHQVIVAAGYYLNHLRPADMLYAVDPLDPGAFSTMSAQELVVLRRNPLIAAFASDGLAAKPLPPLKAEQQNLVLGGEGALWTAMVSDEMLDGRLWPRALTVGERLWSPASVRDPEDMYARLIPAMDQLRALGLLDEVRRRRMIVRLAPDSPDTVSQLVGLVAPVRFFARLHPQKNGEQQQFIELADAASTDGSPARRFRIETSKYLGGDRSQSTLLRTELLEWRDNEAAFAKIAGGRPLLGAAIPTADDIAALGNFGLIALDAIESGKPIHAAQLTGAQPLIKKLKDYEEASKDILSGYTKQQPPADLIILVAPDVERLIDTASKKGQNDRTR
jgi:hexosaminidase